MLSFTGTAGLGTEHTAFDLDADGTDEQVPDAAAGTAFLVFDRSGSGSGNGNGNGVLDDGGELFGPATGDGFAELAAFDADGNGWIDKADPVYTRLGLATSAQGALTSLTDRGVGAIGLASVASPYTFTSGDRISGLLRSTRIWLGRTVPPARCSRSTSRGTGPRPRFPPGRGVRTAAALRIAIRYISDKLARW
jgi:hypothetical protein